MEPYYLHHIYHDFDEFTDAARDWDIDFKQLESGRFRGELLHYILENIQFGYVQLNRHIEQLGTPPSGLRSFAIPAVSHLHLKWCGTTLPPDSVLVFQPSRGLDCVSWGDFNMYVFSIPDWKLEQLCNELGFTSLPEVIAQSDIIRCRADALAKLRCRFATVTSMLKLPADQNTQWIQKTIEYTIPRILLQALVSAQETTQAYPHRMRDAVIYQIREYLDTSPDLSLKIQDLCSLFNVSKRTLEYAFGDHFGTTPKGYLKKRCLNEVRKVLRQRPHKTTRIIDIANQFGFWHMGQFAADYRKLFGELPSETLNKTPA